MSEVAPGEPIGELWSTALARVGDAAAKLARSQPKLTASRPFDPLALWRTGMEAMTSWAQRPQDLLAWQTRAFGQWAEFWGATLRGERAGPEIPRSDRRFGDASWTEQPGFRMLRDAYLVAGSQLREAVEGTTGMDGASRSMLAFMLDQYLNAIAPTNFPVTNPEVLRRTAETGGANLAAGFANLLEDMASGRGIVQRRTDPDAFRKGENVAATPGSVVFQNHLFQLIQYDPTTPDVRAEPLLYVPPLVNRYYMIDLQPRSSLVRWLVEQGRTVFVISWANPDERQRDCDVAAYVQDGVLEALRVTAEVTDRPADLFGFCLGGTLIAIALGYLAAKGEADRANSGTLIGSLVDFSDMRDWSAFIHEAHLDAFDDHLARRGYVESDDLQKLFSAMRANDLIWSSVVNHYLLDRPAPPSDLLYWFEDGARIPQAFLTSYNRQLLRDNRLREPAGFEVGGVPIDIGAIRTPMMVIALKDDHVSAWEAVYHGAKLFGGETEFILGGSGHNAGVINPPAANKHGYWRGAGLGGSAAEWLDRAEKQPGSWWPAWDAWLTQHGGGERVPARTPGDGPHPAIEAAPGSFILSAH